jgi:hypothetical protein
VRSLPPERFTSPYRGVCAERGKWRAQITFGGRKHFLGTFDAEQDAARAYDRAALAHHGSKAITNFVYNDDTVRGVEPRSGALTESGVHGSHPASDSVRSEGSSPVVGNPGTGPIAADHSVMTPRVASHDSVEVLLTEPDLTTDVKRAQNVVEASEGATAAVVSRLAREGYPHATCDTGQEAGAERTAPASPAARFPLNYTYDQHGRIAGRTKANLSVGDSSLPYSDTHNVLYGSAVIKSGGRLPAKTWEVITAGNRVSISHHDGPGGESSQDHFVSPTVDAYVNAGLVPPPNAVFPTDPRCSDSFQQDAAGTCDCTLFWVVPPDVEWLCAWLTQPFELALPQHAPNHQENTHVMTMTACWKKT